MVDAFTHAWGWLVWLGVILVLGVIEVTTLSLVFAMVAVGGVGGLIADLFGAPWWLQIMIAAVVALVLLVLVRPRLVARLHLGGDRSETNVDALPGLTGTVVRDIRGGSGQVKLINGETWTSRLETGTDLDEGAAVVVVAIQGATAIVRPAG